MYKPQTTQARKIVRAVKKLGKDGQWLYSREIIRHLKMPEKEVQPVLLAMRRTGTLEVARTDIVKYNRPVVVMRVPGTPRPAERRVRVYRG